MITGTHPETHPETHAVHTTAEHAHGADCGHETVQHGDHVDYLHDEHRHAECGDHYDEHDAPAEHTAAEHTYVADCGMKVFRTGITPTTTTTSTDRPWEPCLHEHGPDRWEPDAMRCPAVLPLTIGEAPGRGRLEPHLGGEEVVARRAAQERVA